MSSQLQSNSEFYRVKPLVLIMAFLNLFGITNIVNSEVPRHTKMQYKINHQSSMLWVQGGLGIPRFEMSVFGGYSFIALEASGSIGYAYSTASGKIGYKHKSLWGYEGIGYLYAGYGFWNTDHAVYDPGVKKTTEYSGKGLIGGYRDFHLGRKGYWPSIYTWHIFGGMQPVSENNGYPIKETYNDSTGYIVGFEIGAGEYMAGYNEDKFHPFNFGLIKIRFAYQFWDAPNHTLYQKNTWELSIILFSLHFDLIR